MASLTTVVYNMSLRQKERKSYVDIDIDDEDIYGKRNYSLHDKVTNDIYSSNHVKEMKAADVTLGYFQENGFVHPIIVKKKEGLGIRVPHENFTVNDVKQCVGSRRQVDVMNVKTQRGEDMSMKEWAKYYESNDRNRLLNVISLECSHTSMDNYLEQPDVVKQMDWVDLVWPRYLKASQKESTNLLDKMKYPKVQRYCLMSVAGCYTDFHIDMGGTSVWYHILRGQKVFWLIPPTEENLRRYEEWTLTAKQGDVFFPDLVHDCQRITLEAGWTFFIPTGWIHGVYTPEDSLVFGGNFLHSFGINLQLRIWETEVKTRVPQKFRFPFFSTIHWYLLERYVSCIMGKDHRVRTEEELKVEARLNRKRGPKKKQLGNMATNEDAKTDEEETDEGSDNDVESLDDCEPSTDAKYKVNHAKVIKSPTKSPIKEATADEDEDTASETEEKDEFFKKHSLNGCYENLRITVKLESVDEHNDTASSGSFDIPINSDCVKVRRIRAIKVIATERKKLNKCSLVVKKKELTEDETVMEKPYAHLTSQEIDGLKKVILWLKNLPENKRGVPNDIPNPEGLLHDAKMLLAQHEHDDPFLCVTGKPILKWNEKQMKISNGSILPNSVKPQSSVTPQYHACQPGSTNGHQKPVKIASSAPKVKVGQRHRRVRCKVCEPCQSEDCGLCLNCKDMHKFGGPGTKKQSCLARQCMSPILPAAASCHLCGEMKSSDNTGNDDDDLMECHVCFKITHVSCFRKNFPRFASPGVINEDLRNSWDCPKCTQDDSSIEEKKPQIENNDPVIKNELNSTTYKVNGRRSSEESVDKQHESVFNGNTLKRAYANEGQSMQFKKNKYVENLTQTSTSRKARIAKVTAAQSSFEKQAASSDLSLVSRTSRGREVQTPARFRNVFDLFAS